METEKGLLRLLIGHALAVGYLHRAAAVLDGVLYRQGTAELEVNLYGAARSFGFVKTLALLKILAYTIPWLDFHKTKALLVIN